MSSAVAAPPGAHCFVDVGWNMVNQVNHHLTAFRLHDDQDDYYLKGTIDELVIIETALPEGQVLKLYNN